ncbi:lipopolysaccharide transport system ATP-binding protein [Deinococcus metalli]|uniref:ABC transporter ATP-binding protein n=1 Tax=Deinococcus metalli TaxID=1141878 RepID=A0A7W8KG54_9DEIO|nr:ABC transporter ATP-binding protein [Deinococcus metalli]MBB5375944.1 lipopolysaccharide transport system ATP-binding protein [Deinococcus metalli]GHF35922.1 ABC transporter ATP-binding protein [Deinococcus metalli]
MTVALEVRGLSKRYVLGGAREARPDTLRDALRSAARHARPQPSEEFWALRDVAFDVQQGDRLGILGRNGAGKSTLLKVLSRIVEPSAGRVRMRGRLASLLEVGTGFHPELTGRENIYLNGALLGMRRHEIRARFDEIVAFSEVERFLDTPVKRYSSGMYVRLAFSVAAHLEPEILVVDEVLAVGDQDFQKKCLGKMQEVGREGRTVIFVSHNLAAVTQLCTTGLLLEGGRVADAGPVTQVVATYLSRSARAPASATLRDHPGRSGSGGARFTSARLLDASGQDTSALSVGDDLTVELSVDVTRADFGNPVQLSVLVRDSDGTPLANLTDVDAGFALPGGVAHHTVRVALRDLRFYPGTYSLGLWAGSDYGDQTYDLVPDALGFDVLDGGRLTSRRLTRQNGLVYLDAEWSRRDAGS